VRRERGAGVERIERERDVIDASAASPGSRVDRVVDAVDRLFPLAWLGLYLLLPVSGWADLMFTSWFDQQRDLEALRSVIETGRSETVAENAIGPAYIALGVILHKLLGLSPEDSLVVLTRASYALSIAVGMVLVRVVVRRLASCPASVSLTAQFVFVALAFSAGTWYWSDVPWSHFVAAGLGVSIYASRFAPARPSIGWSVASGALLALLALSRSFEAVALVLAWAIALVGLRALRVIKGRTPRIGALAAGAGAFVVTTLAVHAVTGKRNLFFLYGGSLDRQAGDVLPEEIAVTPTFTWSFVPTKLVQLIYEPCFYSMCVLSDYAGSAQALSGPLVDSSGQERLWRYPLAIQLPSLVLLPLCVIAVTALAVWLARHRLAASGREREIRLLVEMTIAASGIVLGYAASTMTGASHLRYGFARDFLLPAVLSGVLAVGLAAGGLWLLLARRGSVRLAPTRIRVSSEGMMMVGALVTAVAVGAAVWAGRTHGLPRMESRQLGPVEYTATCRDGDACEVEIEARTVGGRPISIPEASTLTFGCGSERPRFTVYEPRPTRGFRLTEECPDPRLVAAWPTVMGLPPGRPQLRVVGVANAP
jgi:hypothetical protein